MTIREAKLAFQKDYPAFNVKVSSVPSEDGRELVLDVRVKAEGQLGGVPTAYAGYKVISRVMGKPKEQD